MQIVVANKEEVSWSWIYNFFWTMRLNKRDKDFTLAHFTLDTKSCRFLGILMRTPRTITNCFHFNPMANTVHRRFHLLSALDPQERRDQMNQKKTWHQHQHSQQQNISSKLVPTGSVKVECSPPERKVVSSSHTRVIPKTWKMVIDTLSWAPSLKEISINQRGGCLVGRCCVNDFCVQMGN